MCTKTFQLKVIGLKRIYWEHLIKFLYLPTCCENTCFALQQSIMEKTGASVDPPQNTFPPGKSDLPIRLSLSRLVSFWVGSRYLCVAWQNNGNGTRYDCSLHHLLLKWFKQAGTAATKPGNPWHPNCTLHCIKVSGILLSFIHHLLQTEQCLQKIAKWKKSTGTN